MVDVYLHCSDSNFGNAALIGKWHTLPKPNGNGWDDIGYHYVILNGWLSSKKYNGKFNGHIETGRAVDGDGVIEASERGAHAMEFNKGTLAICLIGKSGKFSDEQLFSTLELLLDLDKQFGGINIFQHSDVDTKKPFCAGIDMVKLRKNYELYKDQMNKLI